MIELVVFDVDGTTVDSHFLLDALQEAHVTRYGQKIPQEKLDRIYGSPVKDFSTILGLEDGEMAQLREDMDALLPRYTQKEQLYPGIRACMEGLRALGCKLAINTSRTLREALSASKVLDWDFAAYCDQVVGCDCVARPKPAPDSLLLACERCGVAKENCLFVGDTIFDASCAQAAGVDFALACWGTKEHLPAAYYPQSPLELLDLVKKQH